MDTFRLSQQCLDTQSPCGLPDELAPPSDPFAAAHCSNLIILLAFCEYFLHAILVSIASIPLNASVSESVSAVPSPPVVMLSNSQQSHYRLIRCYRCCHTGYSRSRQEKLLSDLSLSDICLHIFGHFPLPWCWYQNLARCSLPWKLY